MLIGRFIPRRLRDRERGVSRGGRADLKVGQYKRGRRVAGGTMGRVERRERRRWGGRADLKVGQYTRRRRAARGEERFGWRRAQPGMAVLRG